LFFAFGGAWQRRRVFVVFWLKLNQQKSMKTIKSPESLYLSGFAGIFPA